MNREEWDNEFYAKQRRLSHNGPPLWAFKRAREIMEQKYGPRPDKDQVPAPGLFAWLKLGAQLRSFKMTAHTNVGAWISAFGAAFTAAGAQYALAYSDMVVSGGEWAGIAIQFISVLLATVARFDKKQEAPKAE